MQKSLFLNHIHFILYLVALPARTCGLQGQDGIRREMDVTYTLLIALARNGACHFQSEFIGQN